MNPITPSHSPRPRPAGASPLFTCCLRRGTFVSSDKSTQKRRLKLRFKTSSARYALPQTCLMFLAQSSFPCAAVGQKDCATTAFRYRFAAAACCHGRRFPLYRRTGVLSIPTHPPSLELSFLASDRRHWRGNPFPCPCPRRRGNLFYVLPPAGCFCHQRQKYPKTPLETTFQDFLGALCPVPNLLHASRAIAFPVCRCPSKGLCHHSFPLPLRCRCLLPR